MMVPVHPGTGDPLVVLTKELGEFKKDADSQEGTDAELQLKRSRMTPPPEEQTN
jgi:hypothetical protein